MTKKKKFKQRVRELARETGMTYAQARQVLAEERDAFADAPLCHRCENVSMELVDAPPEKRAGLLRYSSGAERPDGLPYGHCPSCGVVVDRPDLMLAEQAEGRQLDAHVDAKVKAARLARLTDNAEAMSLLGEAFHVLERGVPGIRPWEPEVLLAWHRSGPGSSAEREAAAFVLSVWNLGLSEEAPFHAPRAMSRWDRHNRRAFVGWAKNPWWA